MHPTEEDTSVQLSLDFKKMCGASNFSQIIKEKTAAIEENMKIGSDHSISPMKKQIDMNLIEQIKQRRKEQRLKLAEDGERSLQL